MTTNKNKIVDKWKQAMDKVFNIDRQKSGSGKNNSIELLLLHGADKT